MSEQLLAKLAPRLRHLDKGAYERAYRTRGGFGATSTRQLVADLLDSINVRYRENVGVPGVGGLVADFLVNEVFLFVEREPSDVERKAFAKGKRKAVFIGRESLRSDGFDHGLRVLGLGEEGGLQTIFLDDPTFNFDYAHILPKTEKCSVMHGHTSSVLVEIVGRPIDGMVVDFGAAKQIVKEAVRSMDHKLFISSRYVTSLDTRSVTLKFQTVHGEFAIRAPKDTTVTLNGEASVENLAKEALGRIAPRMPANVTAVGVYVYEGLNKGSHILAKLHQDGATSRRKKR
ncbi:MAG: 6-carboxytetrahydropterin synthase [Nitrososphaerota archaeon]|nr:6-carboxytetrahydropterin synthase [Nitrososphaerota archaeon]